MADHSAAAALRPLTGLSPDAQVLVLSTEGATDPVAYADITGRTPASDPI